jgi:cytochrome c biogenesis protein CcdA
VTGLPEAVISAGSAVWLGLLTSISPCPLATNVAAISYLGRRVDSPRHVLGGGLLYTLGRTATYVALGVVIVMGLLSMPETSRFLQRHMNRILGPVLIVVGILLLEVIRPVLPGLGRWGERLRQRLETKGVWAAIPLGALFALSFCPVSAALFFGSLVPLAVRFDSPVLYPSLYGAGTALPVVGFAILIAFGARFVAKGFNSLAVVERWARRLTAVIFIGVGIYMTLIYTLGIQI